MTGATADVLTRIDGALAGDGTVNYDETGDSMRWQPGLVICHDGAPLWPVPRKVPPLEWDGPFEDDGRPSFTVTGHYRTGQGYSACVRVTVYTEAARAEAAGYPPEGTPT